MATSHSIALPLLLLASAIGAFGRANINSVFIDPGPTAPSIFVPIGADNVTALVLNDERSAWVLYFQDGWLYEPFRDEAQMLRGMIRFGVVHRDDKAVAEVLKIPNSAPSGRLKFRALPCGPAERKLSEFLDTDILDEAVRHASASLPDDLIVRLTDEQSMKKLLTEALSSVPTKFTAVFAIRDSTPTLLHRVLAAKLSNVYNFGLLTRAKPFEKLDRFGLGSYSTPVPGLLVLQTRSPSAAGSGDNQTADANTLATVEISRLDESGILGATTGERDDDEADEPDAAPITYPDALRFLVEYNRNFRRELPGENQADLDEVLLLTSLIESERLSFGVFDLSEGRRPPEAEADSAAGLDEAAAPAEAETETLEDIYKTEL